MKGRAGTLDLFEYVGGFSGPDERFWVFVVKVDVVEDGLNKLFDTFGVGILPVQQVKELMVRLRRRI